MNFFVMYAVAVAISTLVFWVLTRYSDTKPGFINSLIGGVLITTFELMAGMIGANYAIPFIGYAVRIVLHAFTLRAFGSLKGLLLVAAVIGFMILEFMINAGLNLMFNQRLFSY